MQILDWRLRLVSFVVVLSFTIASGFVITQAQQPQAVNLITAEELKAKIAKNEPVTIIDVRSSEGFANSSTTVKGSIHFKLRKLKSRLHFAPLKDLPRDREIVAYCACPKDESSITAAQILQAAGFTHVRVLEGGWRQWVRANGPVEPRTRN